MSRKYGNMEVCKVGVKIGVWPCVYICCIFTMSCILVVSRVELILEMKVE